MGVGLGSSSSAILLFTASLLFSSVLLSIFLEQSLLRCKVLAGSFSLYTYEQQKGNSPLQSSEYTPPRSTISRCVPLSTTVPPRRTIIKSAS